MSEVIDRAAYLKLSDEEKKNWVLITPTASDKELAGSIDMMADGQEILEKLEPIQSKAALLPNPLPGEQMDTLLDKIEVMVQMVDPIKALASVPIIGTLISPLVNLINSIFQVIGFMLMLTVMSSKGQELFTDSICQVVDDTDWDGLKDSIKKLKEKRAELKKQSQEATEKKEKSENDVERKTNTTSNDAMNKIDPEIKKDSEDVKKAADSMYNSVLAADAGAKAVKIVKETTLQNYSWKSMGKKIISTASILGVDFSPLNAPSKEQVDAFEKGFPNPSAVVGKANEAINKINKKKYMRIEEKKVIVDEEKKTITTPKVSLDMDLTEHYKLADLCNSDTAKKMKIDNTPPDYIVKNLKLLAENILEPLYPQFGKVTINSGYRSPKLNAALKGKSQSQHLTGQAADIEIPGVSNFKLASYIVTKLDFDQCILEYAHELTSNPNSGWVHVSYKGKSNRKQALTIGKYGTFAGLTNGYSSTKYT